MIPKSFEYFEPKTLSEVVGFLKKHKENAKVLAGGHSLIPMMKLRLAAPQYIINLEPLRKSLSYIKVGGKSIRIGALVRHAEIEHSQILKRELPILPAAAEWIGDMQVRNMGTIGGSVAHSDPASDWPVVMLSLNAVFTLYSGKKRKVPASKFFIGPFTTAIKPYEVLTEIEIPRLPKRHGWSWKKFERKAGDFATVNVATLILPKDGHIGSASIAVGSVHYRPYRVTEGERLLKGAKPDLELVERVAESAASMAEPTSDLRGSAEYKRHVTKVFVKRSLIEAIERANLNLR
ncbi:MAG: xanthine dehydrogenase family protein subunit M [Aigarchaeota archaeon]|nr:xanthine dehydrogenase family protein subunit M [Aigarchaeota archaeon]MDW8092870.1 xanthine dehydrogenase family protein subunit M [Nitrososphaerota archaeon]